MLNLIWLAAVVMHVVVHGHDPIRDPVADQDHRLDHGTVIGVVHVHRVAIR